MSAPIGPIRELPAIGPMKPADPRGQHDNMPASAGTGLPAKETVGSPQPPLAVGLPSEDGLLMPSTSLSTLLVKDERLTVLADAKPTLNGDLADQLAARLAAAALLDEMAGSESHLLKPANDKGDAEPVRPLAAAITAGEHARLATTSRPPEQAAALLLAHDPQRLSMIGSVRRMQSAREARRQMRGWLNDALPDQSPDAGSRTPRIAITVTEDPTALEARGDLVRLTNAALSSILPTVADDDEEPLPSDTDEQCPQGRTWTIVVDFAFLGRVAIEIVCRGSHADLLVVSDYRLAATTIAFIREMLATASSLGALSTSVRLANNAGETI